MHDGTNLEDIEMLLDLVRRVGETTYNSGV
jgi:hypothetical protein